MAKNVKHVVIEYEHKGYGYPDDLEALLVECTVTFSEHVTHNYSSLAEAREDLERDGFERGADVAPVQTHQGGRYRPIWREVWAKELVYLEAAGSCWGDLSPRAAKAREESQGRAMGYRPRLARTSSRAIVMRPRDGGRQYQKQFAAQVAELLPQFAFNSKHNWWEADLGELETAHQVFKCNLSDGAREYLDPGEVA